MLRIVIIAVISLLSLFPLMVMTTQAFGLNDDAGAVASLILGWILLPYVLLKVWKGKPDLEVLPVDIDDPIMQEQIARARSEFNRFVTGLNEGKAEAFIKFPHDFDGEIEHVWGIAHSLQDDHVVVSLASEPVGEPGEEVMERFPVPVDEVEDWMLVNARGDTLGGYTMLAMATIYEREYGKLPREYSRDLARFTDFNWPPDRRA